MNNAHLPELLIGPRHFFTCPIDPLNWKDIYRWFSKHWNDTIIPFIDDELRIKSAFNSDSNIPTVESLISYVLKNAIITTCQLSLIDFHEFYRSLRTIIPPSNLHTDLSKADSTFSLPGSNYKSFGNVLPQSKIKSDRTSYHESSFSRFENSHYSTNEDASLSKLTLQNRSYSLILPTKNKADEKKKRFTFSRKKNAKDTGKENTKVECLISQPISKNIEIPEGHIAKLVQNIDSNVSDTSALQFDNPSSNQELTFSESETSRVMQSEI